MAERAQVTDIEAIEAFRAKLIVFMSQARACLEEMGGELQRTRSWLENDRREHWTRECRQRSRTLDESEAQLFQARLSPGQTHTAAQLLAVERARASLRQAEAKCELARKWVRQLDSQAEPLARQLEQLQAFVVTDLPKGVAQLGTTVKLLEAYLSTAPALGNLPSPPASPNSGSLRSDGPAARSSGGTPTKGEPTCT